MPSEGTNEPSSAPQEKKPRVDIQAVLDILGRRQEDRVSEEYRGQLDLRKTNLRGANLRGANLEGASLEGADLRGARRLEANIEGASLEGAEGLTQEQLEQAMGDETTKLPEGYEPPKTWSHGEGK